MSKVRRKVAGEERLLVGAVVIVDDDPASRQAVAERVRLGLGESEGVFTPRESDEAVGLLKSLQEDPETEVLVVLVRLLPEVEAGVPELRGLIERIRSEAPSVPVIAYTDRLLAEVREHATAAGASACVSLEDVEAAVYGVFLEDEIGGLSEFTPTVAGVVHTINLGINIVDPQMRVLWANGRLRSLVDKADETRQSCWGRYHKFYHRQCVCALCTAGLALRAAQDKIEAGSIGDNGRLTGSHILPVQGKVACVDVNAAPVLSRDKRRVLAIIEASRIVTEEWEKKTEAHDRIHEVIAAARVLGQEREGAPSFAAVSVYYRPKGGDDLHLFDSAFQEGHDVPKVVRLAELATAYRDVLEDRQPRFLDVARDDIAGDDVARRHFLWAGWTSLTERDVVIDVLYADEKAAGLFTEDLRPYWQYVIENFDAAHESREKAFERSANSFLESFLAKTANGIRDEASLEKVLKAAVECMDRALHPWSMYVRTLDRRTSTLVKRNGFGPYYNMAPAARELRYDGVASGKVAARREIVWSEHADVAYDRQCVGRPLTADEERDLQRIAGHATLPLVCADRVLGALCIQFDDDSPLSPARRSFVEAMASALGNALGSLEWAHQRRTVGEYSEDLDRLMFRRSEHPEEEENELLTQITSKVFELTAAEIVAYYRYDGQSHKLMLVSGATQGSVPKDMALPQVIPADVGVVSRAAGNRQGYRVWDYRTSDWQTVRNRLLAHFPKGPEGEFCRWVGSEIAEPVLGRQQAVAGVLVALSSIPGWLSADDEEVVREFALKTGLCLEAKELMRKLNWYSRTRIALNDITAAMARTSDAGMLYRLLLLGVTADECLGFSRAMLLLCQDADRFVTAEAVGARSRSVAEQQWQEASAIPLSRKVEACSQTPLTRPGDLRELIGQLAMDLRQNPDILRAFEDGRMVVRRQGQSHVVREEQLVAALCPEPGQDSEYVLAPLVVGGEVVGVVMADRAFLLDRRIGKDRLDLLLLLTGEFALMLQAIKLRREEQEAVVAKELARGISYSLRTRAAAFEARIANFAYSLGSGHEAEIEELKRAVRVFFGRVGTLAIKYWRFEEVPPGKTQRIDLDAVLNDLVAVLADHRITVTRAGRPTWILAERQYIDDVLLEMLWNACDFADRQVGRIEVGIRAEGAMARVDVKDNGPGIHPELRPDLFKPFKCFPATRMGLGLSYAARVVEAYGGSMDEIGTWKHGAHFVVRIPTVEGEEHE